MQTRRVAGGRKIGFGLVIHPTKETPTFQWKACSLSMKGYLVHGNHNPKLAEMQVVV
jgi:hypothetical protein